MGSDVSETSNLEGRRVTLVFAEQAKSGRPLKAGDAGIVVSQLTRVGTLTIKLDSGEFVEVPWTHIRPLD
jgi:hypothetical protein